MNNQNSLIVLNRLLALKDNTPIVLILDSLAQSSNNLVGEIVHKCQLPIIYLSFETLNNTGFHHFLDCSSESIENIIKFVQSKTESGSRAVVVVDSLNYIPTESLVKFVTSIVLSATTLVATFHTNCPMADSINAPNPIDLLSYIANSIFDLQVDTKLDEEAIDNVISRLQFPVNANFNSTKFIVNLINKRKSGRSVRYKFTMDTANHVYDIYQPSQNDEEQDEDALLKDLTTFNLSTSSKQKLAKDQVQLPFMEAQQSMGSAGGAIVYEFEKDDDYDEEDPYEDPF
jgi:elongator complex protein 5